MQKWIVTVSTYPPRPCGIATYANSLTSAIDELYSSACRQVIAAMHRSDVRHGQYPAEVQWRVEQENLADYLRLAEQLNADDRVALVHVQHEFGIFGGEFGGHLLTFTDACRKPVVLTFHTVLPSPPPKMRETVVRICADATRVSVMTSLAKQLLAEQYGVDQGIIDVIPHGIPPVPHQSSEEAKRAVGFEGRDVFLTFGLLSRNKGVEYVIEAMAEVVKSEPNALYVLVGATHPNVALHEGESYRHELEACVAALGLQNNVRFHDEYVTTEKLLRFLQAADVYVSTSLDPNQSVSGTLSYALGTGRPVISTRFAQAKELVTPDVGTLVDFRSSKEYAAAMLAMLKNPERRLEMGRAAFARSRKMTWPNVALATMRTYAACVPELSDASITLPAASTEHLARMTDDFGMFQFAELHRPDPASGYTVDDNARALLLAVRFAERKDASAVPLAATYLRFLAKAARPDATFSNYWSQQRQPIGGPEGHENDDDAKGRAFQALAYAAASKALPHELRSQAAALVKEYLAADLSFTSPRASALFVDGLHALWAGTRDVILANAAKPHCDLLVSHYRTNRRDGWEWFEPRVTYANGVLCEALLLGHEMTGDPEYQRVGRVALRFLIDNTFENGMYVGVGQRSWLEQGKERSYFDQQPEDAAATVSVLTTLLRLEPNADVERLRRRAFEWFLGRNMLGCAVYDRSTGGCHDGVGEFAVNLNQGAESTICALLSRLHMETSPVKAITRR